MTHPHQDSGPPSRSSPQTLPKSQNHHSPSRRSRQRRQMHRLLDAARRARPRQSRPRHRHRSRQRTQPAGHRLFLGHLQLPQRQPPPLLLPRTRAFATSKPISPNAASASSCAVLRTTPSKHFSPKSGAAMVIGDENPMPRARTLAQGRSPGGSKSLSGPSTPTSSFPQPIRQAASSRSSTSGRNSKPSCRPISCHRRLVKPHPRVEAPQNLRILRRAPTSPQAGKTSTAASSQSTTWTGGTHAALKRLKHFIDARPRQLLESAATIPRPTAPAGSRHTSTSATSARSPLRSRREGVQGEAGPADGRRFVRQTS